MLACWLLSIPVSALIPIPRKASFRSCSSRTPTPTPTHRHRHLHYSQPGLLYCPATLTYGLQATLQLSSGSSELSLSKWTKCSPLPCRPTCNCTVSASGRACRHVRCAMSMHLRICTASMPRIIFLLFWLQRHSFVCQRFVIHTQPAAIRIHVHVQIQS